MSTPQTQTGAAASAAGPDPAADPAAAAAALARLRAESPRVHCLTNSAAAALTANALLALGAVPSLTDDPDEVRDFAATAGALAVNLGTPDARRAQAIDTAVTAAESAGVPWALDPVMVERSPARRAAARALIARGPAVLRLNAAERTALFDAADAPVYAGVLAVSGTTDRLSRGDRAVSVANGHPLMAKLSGVGCVLGAVTAAFLAVEPDALAAAAAATLAVGVAGETAGGTAAGPGSFQPALLDALAALDADTLTTRARIACDS